MPGPVLRPLAIAAAAAAVLAIAPTAWAAVFLPDFGAATFVPDASITNPYFSLLPGTTTEFRGEGVDKGKTVVEEFTRTVQFDRQTIGGIDAVVVRDTSFVNGVIEEDTLDFYAQDTAGNVWYLGEDVTNYVYDKNGVLIETNHDGGWRTGVNGALPGYAMPADLTLGFSYYQEFAPLDGALDIGTTFATDLTLDTFLGPQTNVLQVLETSDAEKKLREIKYYAPGLGLIQEEEGLNKHFEKPRFTSYLIAIALPGQSAGLSSLAFSATPEPESWLLLIGGFAAVGAVLRMRRRQAFA
jgi:hypothetical protein